MLMQNFGEQIKCIVGHVEVTNSRTEHKCGILGYQNINMYFVYLQVLQSLFRHPLSLIRVGNLEVNTRKLVTVKYSFLQMFLDFISQLLQKCQIC